MEDRGEAADEDVLEVRYVRGRRIEIPRPAVIIFSGLDKDAS